MKRKHILFAALLCLIAGTVSSQGEHGSAINHLILPEFTVELDVLLFHEDQGAYGDHLASALSAEFYPSEGVSMTLFKNRGHRNGTASYKFK